MPIRSVKDLPVEGRRVFVRVDFNVPLTPAGGVADDARIRASLPTLNHLRERGARLIVASHLGRPKGKPNPELSMEPVGGRLAELLGAEVRLTDEPVGDGARKVISDLREGQVALLENLRFEPGEEANDDAFAKQLASYADIYVNDAFGTAHRAHASTVGMVQYFAPELRGAGLLMDKEILFMSKLLGDVEKPYLAVIGGAKVSDKIGVLEALAQRVQKMIIGGAMANTFLAAKGFAMGKSLVEESKLALARSFLQKADLANVEIVLPVDLIVAEGIDAKAGRSVRINECPPDMMALDIGPTTARNFADECAKARTIFWNGPMGMFEKPPFAHGTLEVARAVARNDRALRVVGGGDSVAAADQAGIIDKLDHVSTGGGASLEFIEGKVLPGIAVLDTPVAPPAT